MKIITDRSYSPKFAAKDFNSELHLVLVTKEEIASKKTALKNRKQQKLEQEFGYQYYSENFNIDQRFAKANFTGSAGQVYTFESLESSEKDGGRPVVFIGFEEKTGDYLECEVIRRFGSTVFSIAKKYNVEQFSISTGRLSLKRADRFAAFIEGFELTNYKFNHYFSSADKDGENLDKNHPLAKELARKPRGITALSIFSKEQLPVQNYQQIKIMTDAIKQARDLINLSAKDCTPSYLVKVAREVARESKLGIKVYDKDDLQKMGANLILAVANGSDEPPYLINLTYKPKKPATKIIALVGKGVTFDSGGLSIKTAQGMESMKDDMSGAAAVIAAMKIIGKLQPNAEIRAYIPTTENMINGKATRPGDIVKALNGKSVEILNTDAEGRLILADAVHLAEKEGAGTIIDLATLTGAIIAALGGHYAGLFTDNDKLAEQLTTAGAKAGERYWRMPLIEEHKDYLKSKWADIKHITAPSKGAGATNGALFIKYFVEKAALAHLDIAGTAYIEGDRYYLKSGGTGFGVATLIRYIMGLK